MCFLGRNKQIGKANLKAYTYLRDEENQKDRRPYETEKDYSLNRLAEIVEENLDMDIIDKLLFE